MKILKVGPVGRDFGVSVPTGSRVLCTLVDQYEQVVVYVERHEAEAEEFLKLRVIWTGEDVDSNEVGAYVGTVLVGSLVGHVYAKWLFRHEQ